MKPKPDRADKSRRDLQFARNLDWNLLKFFHEIASARSVTKAAQELNRKQPALSLALRRLEERLGVTLCYRGPTGFELTEEGRILAERCRGFADSIRAIPARLSDAKAEIRGHLRVMLVSNLVAPALDEAIGAFHAKYPAVELIVEVAAWTEVVNSLMQHRIDVGISPSRVKRAELAYLHLFTEVHRPYCGRPHRLFGKSVPNPADLAQEAFVLTGADEGDELTQFRLEHGLGRNIAGMSDHLEEAKRLAVLGVGLCFLPEGYAQPDVDAGRLWPLLEGADVPHNNMFVVTDPQSPAHIARDLFIAEIVEKTLRANALI
ncbi:LysR family transcriptional regulator [Mesorhizobium sp. CO1-1-11]|uniref:LysR family transcriptional regulator n=1 Tax=Mesorhizobium sp. CO1-1-11 TaxID=2876636 RepID=UPI001CCE0DE0|nr:LysR family transcriptional regulator [Mesorhizobium sp. CO1-1-11]MBZ9725839.1 LysR family transcriptional regulator [Mesorhizobium sp. CO1-1-11]